MFSKKILATGITLMMMLSFAISGYSAEKAVKKATQTKVIDRSGRVSKPLPLVSRGLSMVGTRYKWGGASYKGVDCSGLMMLLFKKEGVNLPHSARQQYRHGVSVEKSNLIPGDLLFFNTRGSISHVGMYIGNKKFVHAVDRRRGVKVDSIDSAYYKKRFIGAKRVLKS